MIDRDLILIVTGGLIGALSSLATLAAVYWLEGMRLRRKWRREDELQLRADRARIESLLGSAFGAKGDSPPDTNTDT
ncbi:MAG: hypothetical protein Kow0031_16000 [Anaerolineae bacterium]